MKGGRGPWEGGPSGPTPSEERHRAILDRRRSLTNGPIVEKSSVRVASQGKQTQAAPMASWVVGDAARRGAARLPHRRVAAAVAELFLHFHSYATARVG